MSRFESWCVSFRFRPWLSGLRTSKEQHEKRKHNMVNRFEEKPSSHRQECLKTKNIKKQNMLGKTWFKDENFQENLPCPVCSPLGPHFEGHQVFKFKPAPRPGGAPPSGAPSLLSRFSSDHARRRTASPASSILLLRTHQPLQLSDCSLTDSSC